MYWSGFFIGGLLLSLLLSSLSSFSFLYRILWQPELHVTSSPLYVVESYLERQIIHREISETIAELPLDGFAGYVATPCVKGSYESVRAALLLQLGKLPKPVCQELANMAVVQGVSHTNAATNTVIEPTGVAYTYLFIYSSAFTEPDTYEVCASVGGLTLKVAEQIAGFEEFQLSKVIGTQPCNCNWLGFCQQCPLIDKVTVRKPVFKRHALNMQQTDDLKNYLIKSMGESLGLKRFIAMDPERRIAMVKPTLTQQPKLEEWDDAEMVLD